MSNAVIGTRCIGCGWAHMTWPDGAPREKRYIKCVNSNCPEYLKRYAVPVYELKPVKGGNDES